jgi:hypothetical protein
MPALTTPAAARAAIRLWLSLTSSVSSASSHLEVGGTGLGNRLTCRHGGTLARHLQYERPREESNLRTQLRRLPLCPLSYGATRGTEG